MFVFFEFFAPFFKNLWINYLNHLSQTPVCIPKYAAKGASLQCARALKCPPQARLKPTSCTCRSMWRLMTAASRAG